MSSSPPARVVGIFPQGTCQPFRRRPFHRTAAKLALETGVPLISVALVGTERILRPHRPRLGLPKVRVLVGDPIRVEPQRPTLAAAKALTGPARGDRLRPEAADDDSAAVIRIRVEGDASGFFAITSPVVRRQVRRSVETDLRTLKALLEQKP